MHDDASLPKKSNTLLTGVVVFAIIAALSVGTVVLQQQSSATTNQTLPTVAPGSQPTGQVTDLAFKDGTYEVTGAYTSPGGPETIAVKVTLESGAVTAAEVVAQAEHPISQKFQTEFVDNFQPMVVGKPIAELQLDKVAGSSLTPKGFNDALEKIMDQAQS